MNIGLLLQKINEGLSNGTLHHDDEVVVRNSNGHNVYILDAVPDTETSDFLIMTE